MDSSDLWLFESKLKELQEFLIELQAFEPKLLSRGYAQAANLKTYEKGTQALEHISKNYNSLASHVRVTERFVTFPKFDDLPKAELLYGISAINSAIKVAVKGNKYGRSSPLSDLLGVKRYSVFSATKMDAVDLYFELDRLTSIVFALREREDEISQYESKEFKPGNIRKEQLLHLISNALYSINESSSISPAEKKQLKAIFSIISEQISRNNTKWINVVGALGLALAILQSIAVAPEAFQNTKAAYDYLMKSAQSESELKFINLRTEDENRLSSISD